MSFAWRHGYEWELPNELDRDFDRGFKDRLKGHPAVITCRSPWVRLDLDAAPAIFRNASVIGVNHSLLALPANFCVSSGDPQFWQLVRPSEWPQVTFILAGSQRNLDNMAAHQWPNVRAFTAPPELPPEMQGWQRRLPRPFHCDNTGNAAVWLAWYMGAAPLYIAGAHHRLCETTIHGDSPELDPDDGGRSVRHYQQTLPQGRRELQKLVAVIRADGVTVHWPGEEGA
jgi:hypothetical protein